MSLKKKPRPDDNDGQGLPEDVLAGLNPMERWGRRKTVFFLSGLVVFSTLALYAYSYTMKPLAVEPGEVSADMAGKLVCVHGVVVSSSLCGSGWGSFVIGDVNSNGSGGGGNCTVFVPEDLAGEGPEIHPGDAVEVVGRVQVYNGIAEVVPRDGGDIRVITFG